jgi:hypothetical protein
MNVNFLLHKLIITGISIIEIVRVFLDFTTTTKLVYRDFSEYVANARGTWFLIKGAPPRGLLDMINGLTFTLVMKYRCSNFKFFFLFFWVHVSTPQA